MSQPVWLKKYLRMDPKVTKIFDDLESWHDHCRLEMIKFDPADLYSAEYKAWRNEQARKARKEARVKQIEK